MAKNASMRRPGTRISTGCAGRHSNRCYRSCEPWPMTVWRRWAASRSGWKPSWRRIGPTTRCAATQTARRTSSPTVSGGRRRRTPGRCCPNIWRRSRRSCGLDQWRSRKTNRWTSHWRHPLHPHDIEPKEPPQGNPNVSIPDRSIFKMDLVQTPANHVPLSPVSFLLRAARVYPNRVAVIHGARRYTYLQFLERTRRLASALARAGIGKGDTVAILAPNIPEMLEAHNAVPATGAVLCPINTRLDAPAIAFILRHSAAKVVLIDRELAPAMRDALTEAATRPLVVDIDDPLAAGGEKIGTVDYETFISTGDPSFALAPPDDEWQASSLNYRSGVDGNRRCVVLHHRGAYLNAAANALTFQLSPSSVYLWTLPMFHCDGWTYTWAVTLAGGVHVCLRRVDPAAIFPAIAEHKVTHMCGAPVVLSMLIHAPTAIQRRFDQTVRIATGGAAPPSPVIARMEEMGFEVRHLYGLTESFGPATVCMWQPSFATMSLAEKSAFMARQGVNTPMLEGAAVFDPSTML